MRSLPKIEMQGLIVFVIILVVAGIAAMIGLNIIDDLGNTACTNGGFYYNGTSGQCELNDSSGGAIAASTLETNASTFTSTGISNITGQFPNIGLVIGAVVIIGLLISGFAFAFSNRGGNIV